MAEGKKKSKPITMSLSEFQADTNFSSGGAWADDAVELPTAPASRSGGSSYADSSRSRGGEGRYDDDGAFVEMRGGRRDGGSSVFGGSRGGDRFERPSRFGGRGDYESDRRDGGERREFSRNTEIPDRPPFTAFIGNLSFQSGEQDVADFFAGAGEISNIRVLRDRETDRPKGAAVVTFATAEGLRRALDLHEQSLGGRRINVSVSDAARRSGGGGGFESREEVNSGNWRRETPLEPSRPQRAFSDRSGDRDRGDRGDGREEKRSIFGTSRRQGQDAYRSEAQPQERKRLVLQPKASDAPQSPPPSAPAAAAAPAPEKKKSNPFGDAKPRDENEIMRRKEEERAKREAEAAAAAAAEKK